jgi:hypothetical protein
METRAMKRLDLGYLVLNPPAADGRSRDGGSGLFLPAPQPTGAGRGQGKTLNGYLTARPSSRTGSERDDYYLYDLAIDGEAIVTGSRTPEFDACRVLAARGLTGELAILDTVTKKLRLTVDIEVGAKLTVLENRKHGPRFAKWKSFERGTAR